MTFQAPYDIVDMQRLQMAEAQNQQAQQQAMMEGIQQGIGTLMGAYAENEAMNAKGKAYGDFLKKHGSQLGFDPTYLDDLLKKKPRDLALVGDGILGMNNMGNRVMSLNYMNQQMAPRATPVGTGTAATAGAGGGGGGDVLTF